MEIKIIPILIGLLVAAVLVSGCAQKPVEQIKNETVIIKDFAFNPQNITIKSGATITWVNEDSVTHDVTNDAYGDVGVSELFDIDLEPGQSRSFTFTETGEYNYHCAIHPSMTGKIIVE